MNFNDILNEMANVNPDSVDEIVKLIKDRKFKKAVELMNNNTQRKLGVVPGIFKGKISDHEMALFRSEVKLINKGIKTEVEVKAPQPKRSFAKANEFEKIITTIPFKEPDKSLRKVEIRYKGSFFKDLGELAGIHINESENNPMRIMKTKIRAAINGASVSDLTKSDGRYKNAYIEAKKASPSTKSINFAEIWGLKSTGQAANLLGGNPEDYSRPLDKSQKHPLKNEKFDKIKKIYNTVFLPFVNKEIRKIQPKIDKAKPYLFIGNNADDAVLYKPSQYDLKVVTSNPHDSQSQRAEYQGFNRILLVAKIKDGEKGTLKKDIKDPDSFFGFSVKAEESFLDFHKELFSV